MKSGVGAGSLDLLLLDTELLEVTLTVALRFALGFAS